MKNLIKKLTIAMLIAAITLTSIIIPDVNATTVYATTTTGTFKNGSTITMKPGDKKKLLVTDTNNCDITSKYKWSSSDKNIIKVETDFYNEKEGYTQCVVVTAVGTGTATVTGDCKGWQPDIKMTIKVSLPKATAKQKKCKHSYKTTKSATCERAGIKTCKKCKFQKLIAKADHKYVKKTVSTMEYDYYTNTICCGNCPFTCTIKYDKNYNVTPDSDYPSFKAATDAMEQHIHSVPHVEIQKNGITIYGNWSGEAGYAPYGPEHFVTKTANICKWCGKEKN